MKTSLAFAVLLFLPSLGLANETNDIARRTDYLNRADAMNREYLLIRSDVDRANGLRSRFDAISVRLSTWIKSWDGILTYLKNPPDMSLQAIEKVVGDKVNSVSDLFHQIDVDATQLILDLQDHETRLRILGTIGYSIEAYDLGKTYQDRAEARNVELANSLKEQISGLRSTMDAFRGAMQHLRTALSAKIAALWAAKGIATLDESLHKVDELFVALDLVDDLESKLILALGKFQSAQKYSKMIEASDSLRLFLDSCKTQEAELKKLPIGDSYKERSLARFKTLCSTHQLVYDKMTKDLGLTVYTGYAARSKRIANVCSNEATSGTMNCKLYTSIANLSEKTVRSLRPENFLQLEQILNAVENNNRSGRIFSEVK